MKLFSIQTLFIVVLIALAIGIAVFNPHLYPLFSTESPDSASDYPSLK